MPASKQGKANAKKSNAAKSTVSGPAAPPGGEGAAARQMEATQAVAAAFAANPNKKGEHGEASRKPKAGATADLEDPSVTASTLTETHESDKVGTQATPGTNPANDPLDRVRVSSDGKALTTNFGVPIADKQKTLRAGLRGPALLEDFILREKITHFDHERIPERIVHARGSGAHGFFECYEPLTKYTQASFLAEAGKQTPVFVRFSTVAGERGSTDTPRDARGFATKFYTDQGSSSHRTT